MRVGFIGYGAIGRAVGRAIEGGLAGDTTVSAILVRHPAGVRDLPVGAVATDDPAMLLTSDAELVVEVAGHAALRQHLAAVLESGRDLMTLSVGAFADAEFLSRAEEIARRAGRRILIPSGAIAGLDMISAAALAPLDTVTHTTRKHPRAFTAEQLGGIEPTEAVLLYDGPARDGVGRFPENVNVAAAVSLAGIGLDRTRLRVYADPAAERNVHVVEVAGYFGRLRLEVENQPSENPKTGRVVPLSVAKALRNLSAPVVLGL